uniref:Putative type III restriction enzyme n=1 Tax=viral metagenome TaxID=1070528 RepID=A0A6M3JCQ7_9ZZZZ
MTYTLRPYQQEAVDAAVAFLSGPSNHNAIEVLPTGSGKSLIIASIVSGLGAPVLVFQPSKEILEQNLSKLEAYGYRGAVYSASKGRQEIANITFATIGSVVNKAGLFTNFPYVIVDECHRVNAKEGMYKIFLVELEKSGAKILGLTATPYRLASNSFGSELRFLTRTRPKVFHEMIYFIQNRQLFDDGYLAKLEYATSNGFDRERLQVNSTGADYTDESVQRYYRVLNFQDKIVMAIEREMETRKNALVFTRFVQEAEYLVHNIEGAAIVTGETPKKERERLIDCFKAGDIPVICNCGVLTTGFDYPELETVILARPTMSLGLYYQMIGRSFRPHPKKESARVVDLCGNYAAFGKIEDLEIMDGGNGKWFVSANGKQLTNVYNPRY